MATCRSCGQENRVGARFCDACGASLDAARGEVREVRKTVTVVFCDVTSSTALGERLDPESVRRVMSRYFDEMRAAVERHGGTVEKFIGDAVMAVFGIPTVHEDDALRGVRAAVQMREALERLNEELERERGLQIAARIGVNTGEVVAGDPTQGGAFATGDAVNVAARLEQAAQPGEILIGESTQRLVKDAARGEPVESLTVKGKAEPVAAYRLLTVEADIPGHARRLDSPMVGRERELRLLHDAFERVTGSRACHLFTILGAAGVGKSRLVDDFLQALSSPATIVRGRCLPYGDGITYWPISEIVREAATLEGTEALDQAFAKIGGLLAADEDAPVITERIAELVGLSDAGAATEETFWAVRKLLEHLARDVPLVAVFDDVHWGEPTFLDLIEHIADWSRDTPILIVCLARPELLDERHGWSGGKLNATSILLDPLNEADCDRLIENLLGQARLDEAIHARITEAAEGNPLFVEEMLAMLIDDGRLKRVDGGWVARADLSDVPVPPSIQALLAARLDRLGSEEREVIKRAAVEGKVFHRGAVEELSPELQRPSVGAHLLSLVRKELLRRDRPSFAGEEAFRFRHLLIRDAAYDALPKEARAKLHERFAAWLEQKAGARLAEYEEILGYHLAQAHAYRAELGVIDAGTRDLGVRAGARLASAGLRAGARGDLPGAVALLSRAVGLLPPDDGRRLDLLPRLGELLVGVGELERAEALLVDTIEEAARAGARRTELRARLERLALEVHTSPTFEETELSEAAREAVPLFEREGDEEGLARAWSMLGYGHWAACRYAERAETLERALQHAQRARDIREQAEILNSLALSLVGGPKPVPEGIRRCEELRELSRGHRALEASLLGPLGSLYAQRGDFARARQLYAESKATFIDLGLKFRAALGTVFGGRIELLADNPAAAEQELRWGYGAFQAMGETYVFSTVAGLLAAALYEQERYEEVEQIATAAKEATAPNDVLSEILWRGPYAKVLARRAASQRAEELAREAVALAQGTDALNTHGDALIDLAEVLRILGRPLEGISTVEAGLHLYEAKENTVAAAKAQTLLDKLASTAATI